MSETPDVTNACQLVFFVTRTNVKERNYRPDNLEMWPCVDVNNKTFSIASKKTTFCHVGNVSKETMVEIN